MAAKKKAPSRKSAARRSQDTLIAAEYARLDREIAKNQSSKKAGVGEFLFHTKKTKKRAAKKAPAKKATARKMPRAPRRAAPAPSATSMASRFLRAEGFDDILEWKAGNTSGMMPLMDTPYHSKAKDIAEACAAKKKGEYEKVWRVNSNGRQEICMAPLAGLTKKKAAKKSRR